MVAQELPGEQHVFGGDLLAVGEARAGIETERDIAPLVVGLDGFGEQAVERERFVLAARQQALDHVGADRLHGQSLHNERIEAVEGAEEAPGQPAALGGIGVGIGHVGEIGRQRRLAMHGDCVGLLGPRATERRQSEGEDQSKAAESDTGALEQALEHEHSDTLIRGPAEA